MMGQLAIGSWARESASMTTNWAPWSTASEAFQRKSGFAAAAGIAG